MYLAIADHFVLSYVSRHHVQIADSYQRAKNPVPLVPNCVQAIWPNGNDVSKIMTGLGAFPII